MKYVSFKDGYYWVRIVPNPKLLPYLPIKKQYIKSLGDVTQSQAEKLAIPVISKWLSEIEKAKGILAAPNEPTTDKTIQKIFEEDSLTDEMFDKVTEWVNNSWASNDKPNPEFLARYAMARQDGTVVESSFYVNQYKKTLSHLKSKTISQRISRIETQFLPNFEYLSAKTLTTGNIQWWIDSYLKLEKPPTRKTLKGYLDSARLYVEWLRRKGYLNIQDTFNAAQLPSEKQLKVGEIRTHFEDEELRLILDNVKDKELKVLILLAMYTGCRIEELMQLKPEDIKPHQGRYLINITRAKTKAGERSIPISKEIEAILLQRLNYTGYIFPYGSNNETGTRSDAYSKTFGRLKTKLGFGRDKVFHSIRKTVATKLEQAAIAEGVAADLLGHEKQSITYGLYSSGSSFEDKLRAIDSITFQSELD